MSPNLITIHAEDTGTHMDTVDGDLNGEIPTGETISLADILTVVGGGHTVMADAEWETWRRKGLPLKIRRCNDNRTKKAKKRK